MSAPDLTIQVEPVEASALVYASLAARSSADQPNGQLLLVLKITNNEPSPIEVTEVMISFVGPPNIAPFVIKLPPPTTPPTLPTPLTIASGATGQWTLLESWNPNIILPVPAPATIKVSLSCVGLGSAATVFSAPAEVSMPLAQYSSPVAAGGYAFPFKAADLNQGEFLTGLSSGDYHRARAYDILVYKYQSGPKAWQAFPAGADTTKNESYYIWDKPIYAIADGVVAQVVKTMPNNTARTLPAAPAFGEGNHFYIRHGAEIVLYAHFKAGTIGSTIAVGDSVVKGQLLGRAGNSGRSWEPHLHISVSRALGIPPPEEPLRPLPFIDIYVLGLPAVATGVWPPDNDTPWNHVSAQCLPSELSAIWPGYLRISKKRFFAKLTWAWMVIIGALMITPGGGACIACGPVMSPVLGVVSVVLGVVGFVLSAMTPSGETVPEAVTLSQRLGKEHELS